MAAQRSSFSLRLQQLFNGVGRSVSPSIKLDSEPPPKVKAFIDRVINCPLHDIAIPLSGFRWEYNKGNFNHWRPLFLHFETYFKTYIACRDDLNLSGNISEDTPLPKNSIIQILRVMQIIMENCHNKSSFSGLEHLKLLLASSDPEIVIATLETLCTLVRISLSKIQASSKITNLGSINSHLLSLAQGWGSKEEGLGLHSCVVATERNQNEGLSLFPPDTENNSNNRLDPTQYRLGSTLHFECNVPDQSQPSKPSNTCVIHMPDLHLIKDDDLVVLKQCVNKFHVPQEHRFSLFTRIRYARAFSSPRISRMYTKISLLSFVVLVQSSDAHDEIVSFFTNEPEYTNELVRLVRSEDSVPASVRSLAMHALGAQLAAYASSHERARVLGSSSVISAGGNRMVLIGVLQKAILSLNNPNDPSSPLFVEALLQFFLLHVLSSSTSGSAIRGSGLVPPFLPLLQDRDPTHMNLVYLAVKTLQKLMEFSGSAVALFKDLGGVELLVSRLQTEVERLIGANTGEASISAMVIADVATLEDEQKRPQKRLIKVLLKALGTVNYSHTNTTRTQHSSQDNSSSLPGSLSLIFRHMDRFGGDIYYGAVTVMSDMIHKDPTCYPALKELGLPDAFLSSVTDGVIPSSRAIVCVPNGLGAICLNTRGMESVRETSALRFLVDLFTTRKYLIPMNEGVILLSNAVEELLRHASSLRSTGVDIIVEILNKLLSMGESSGTPDETTDMETDVETKVGTVEGSDLMAGPTDPTTDSITDEQFLHLCIFHIMVLVHRTTENSETCRLFVEKGGIEILLKLLLRPGITQSSEGMPIALHSTVVFKSFTQHHSAPLARAFSSALRDHLKKALNDLAPIPGSSALVPKSSSEILNMPSLFIVEFLLFLAASKDNRWINALLAEFADAGRDVLEDIGQAHREVMWQIALLEDCKDEEMDTESPSPSTSDSQRPDLVAVGGETDDGRLGPFRQYLDPLLRRRSPGWTIESQVSDLINIYRDIGRSTSGSGSTRTDRYLGQLGPPPGSSSDVNSSAAAATAGSGSGSKTEEDNKKSNYSTSRDMMTSLSYHIDHLFTELGKAMLLISRRENNPVNVPPSVVSLATTISSVVLDHLNFAGHAGPAEGDVPVTTKCRYLGKVVDFIDGVLMDRPESCNPIVMNCFYGRGVIQSILTTFEATSQLLFALTNRAPPASPMETEDSKEEKDETEFSWIYGPLASYATLMDHMVTSPFILSSSTRQLLEQPICNSSIPFPADSEAFVKMLQSRVLKTVLPIWSDPHFPDCDFEFVGAMMSIMRHVYSGIEVKNTGTGSGSGARLAGPPPDESAIALIVEMGFTRARAEEALRQVGTNSVEIATDWLFSHPEEPQEDAELARALAMSLGNSDNSPSKEEETASPTDLDIEEEIVQLPPVDEILTSCVRLLQTKEFLAFPIRDMLVTICSQNDGEYRSKVLTFVIDHVRNYCAGPDPYANSAILSALFHVIALVLHEDAGAREVAAKAGLVKVALDLLSGWDMNNTTQQTLLKGESEKNEVPKWVTSCFLSIDRMLQADPKLPDITELDLLKPDGEKPGGQKPVVIEENQKKDSAEPPAANMVAGLLDTEDQNCLLALCCKCIQNQFPSETMHVVLKLSATLTKVHSAAVSFLNAGGLQALLGLPTRCLFAGFNRVTATIIRHIIEDPHTLQQAMELEIRHSLIMAASRHSNPRVSPRNFVQNLSFVISRDPVVFVRAAQAACQIEMIGDRPYIVLLKDREKEKGKEKEEKKISTDKDKPQTDPGTKSAKTHKKSPQSFATVIEYLLDLMVTYVPPPKSEDQSVESAAATTLSAADMDIDSSTSAKGKGKAVAISAEQSKADAQEASTSLAKTAFILKLLTDILLTYASSIYVLLRRDAELSSLRGPASRSGGVFNHILHKFLPYSGKPKKEKKTEADWRHKLATRANQFLVASSIRSVEARKRIFSDVCNVLGEFVESCSGCKAPDPSMNSYIDLLNDILGARSPTGSTISGEASATFIDVGLVKALTRTLHVLDLDHPDSQKVVTTIVKALELVSKEHVQSSELKAKDGSLNNASDGNNQAGSASDQPLETRASAQPDSRVAGRDALNSTRTSSSSSDSGADDMDHDGDDFVRDIPADGVGRPGTTTVEITFDIPAGGPGEDMAGDDVSNDDDDVSNDNDDEDMSGDEEEEDGEEVDEEDDDVDDDDVDDEDDDGENNRLDEEEEEEMHRIAHPDTDPDEHEMDEEFDEDMLEEEEEEEEDEEEDGDGVILRLEERMGGINVFDHIEVFGGTGNFPGTGDTLRVMPLDIFGTRRQGRTTSIYSLLGGRSGDSGPRLEHPLLEEPSSLRHLARQRQSDNPVDIAFSDRNTESTSSRLDAIFRTLRGGSRQNHRFNMWLDDSQPRGSGSSAPVVPQGLEDLIVSHLRRPEPERLADQSTPSIPTQQNDTQNNNNTGESEPGPRDRAPTSENLSVPPSVSEMDGNSVQGDASNASEQATDMQYERSEGASLRDVEAISQASSGSAATLGESLRSLEVEIGSVEGHDEGLRRPPPGMVTPPVAMSGRDISLESVSEVTPAQQNPSQEEPNQTDGGAQEGQGEDGSERNNMDSDSIDPTFLEALPEELRAEVLNSRQSQAGQPSGERTQPEGEIDPEFLAALPPDIREEVLAQQRAQRLQQQSQELEGQPVEMDAVSIIATFPSEIREEVLLTSPDTLLATLTPALVTEANMLRERFAHRYHSSSLFGMSSRNRRGESSRRGNLIGSGLDRNASDRSASKVVDTDGAPLVDTDALKALIRLLRVVQPLYKGQMQRLLLNLCAHRETRTCLVQILVDMLMLDLHSSTIKPSDNSSEPPFRLYGCQTSITFSRPQHSDGVPPLVTRRVLETLTYLARNHPTVAKLLLYLEISRPAETPPDRGRGKAVIMDLDRAEDPKAFAIVLLLTLLNQPLYMRSVAHLEQLLNLLEVVMINTENEMSRPEKPEAPAEKPSEESESSMQDAPPQDNNNNNNAVMEMPSSAAIPSTSTAAEGSAGQSQSTLNSVLENLPQAELRLLCSLLAREGLSDNAYSLVAEVLKKIVSLAPAYCSLFITELALSMQTLILCAMNELLLFEENTEKALLSASSTNGTAILRVLQALSSLVSTLQERKDQDQSNALAQISDINSSLDSLWLELSNSISKIENSPDCPSDLANATLAPLTGSPVAPPLPAGTQNILPYIESFFVACEKLRSATSQSEPATSALQDNASTSSDTDDTSKNALVRFSEKHRKLLNAFVRQNPSLLEKSFALMLKIPRLIDFDNKRAYFRSKIKHQHDHHHSPVRISVRRAYILEDSYNQLRMRSPLDLKGRLTVHFQGEEGIDAGGLTREWYQMLSRVIFDKGALLFTTVGNESTFQPNPNSVFQTEHLSYFKFVGRVVGKALFDGQLLDVHFTRSFYKHILGVKVTYHDIEAIDPGYYKNLKWMLENDISDVLDLTFSMDADEEKHILYEKNEVTDCELIPGGRNIRVTEENKQEYVNRVAEHRLTTAIRPQINAFMEGFNELIPRDLISIFNDKELELLISGLPDIDLDDLKANTEYSGYSIASPVIQWFWDVVPRFSKEDKARFLQFVTGTSKVPLEGFSALQGISGPQKFQIHKAYGSSQHLPSAHTCFNQLDLPEYTSKEQLQDRLLLAIHEANEGFGFG